MADDALRCAVHPSLPAVDTCPVCARPRCGADATAAPGGGCRACEGRTGRTGPAPLDRPALVRAGLLCNLVAPPGGMIASQYVDAGLISYAVPVFVGIAVSMAAEFAVGKKRGRALRYLALGYSVLTVALGFQPTQAAFTPFDLRVEVLGPYVLAAAASWLWTAPPRVVAKKEPA